MSKNQLYYITSFEQAFELSKEAPLLMFIDSSEGRGLTTDVAFKYFKDGVYPVVKDLVSQSGASFAFANIRFKDIKSYLKERNLQFKGCFLIGDGTIVKYKKNKFLPSDNTTINLIKEFLAANAYEIQNMAENSTYTSKKKNNYTNTTSALLANGAEPVEDENVSNEKKNLWEKTTPSNSVRSTFDPRVDEVSKIVRSTILQEKYRFPLNLLDDLFISDFIPQSDVEKVISGGAELLKKESPVVFFQPFRFFGKKNSGALLTSEGLYIKDKKYGPSTFKWGDIQSVYVTDNAFVINNQPALKFNTNSDEDTIFFLILFEIYINTIFSFAGEYTLDKITFHDSCLACASPNPDQQITVSIYGALNDTFFTKLGKEYAVASLVMGAPHMALLFATSKENKKRQVAKKLHVPICASCMSELSRYEKHIGGGFFDNSLRLISDSRVPETLNGNRYIAFRVHADKIKCFVKSAEYARLMLK